MMTVSASDDLQAEDETTNASTHDTGALVAHSQEETEQQRISRHVRFGEVQDVAQEMEKKKSLEKERQVHVPVAGALLIDTEQEVDKSACIRCLSLITNSLSILLLQHLTLEMVKAPLPLLSHLFIAFRHPHMSQKTMRKPSMLLQPGMLPEN